MVALISTIPIAYIITTDLLPLLREEGVTKGHFRDLILYYNHGSYSILSWNQNEVLPDTKYISPIIHVENREMITGRV